jgi:hypothetical protein
MIRIMSMARRSVSIVLSCRDNDGEQQRFGAHDRLPLSLFHSVRRQMRRMRDGNIEAICGDEPEWQGRVLASRMLHDLKGA